MSQFPYQSQPVYIDGSTVEAQARERAFFASVYRWMFGGLLLTALASMWVVSSPAMQQIVLGNRAVMIGLLLAELGIVIFASAKLNTLTPAAAATCFLVYSLLTGLTLSVIFFVYSQASIVQAFATSAGMFGAMSIYGRVTKRSLVSWGSFLFMGVIGIIIAMIVNMFIASSALSMAISTIGVFIFTGLVAYKTQMLRQYAHTGADRVETFAIYGALSLYITFINLFLSLLRLFGGSRRS